MGVEQYRDPNQNLEGVSDDVRLLKKALTAKGGFQEKDVKVLLNSEATKENIVKSFNKWLIEGTAPGDIALFYFSGHGIQVLG